MDQAEQNDLDLGDGVAGGNQRRARPFELGLAEAEGRRRPETIQEEVVVDLPPPRDLDAPEYLVARDRIFSIMGMDAHGGGAGQPH